MFRCLGLAVFFGSVLLIQGGAPTDEAYLNWTMQQVESVGKDAYRRGRVGGLFDARMLKTERSYNYKLAGTWLTPEVIRATARMVQLRSRLQDDETQALVAEAEAAADTIFIVEIDPREGSGVIPNEWEAFLQPKGRPEAAVRGSVNQELRAVRALAGILRRNYDYDRFWVTFPLDEGGRPLFTSRDRLAELVVRIYDKEGRIEWPVPQNLAARSISSRNRQSFSRRRSAHGGPFVQEPVHR